MLSGQLHTAPEYRECMSSCSASISQHPNPAVFEKNLSSRNRPGTIKHEPLVPQVEISMA
jgi:hypothetical protein